MTVRSAFRWALDTTGGLHDLTPVVTRAQAIDSVTVEVAFNAPMLQGAGVAANDALNVANYTLPGLTITSAVAFSQTRVRLTVNEMLNGSSYAVTAAATLVSTYGKTILSTQRAATFKGLGTLPRLVSVNTFINTNGTNVRLVFSEPLAVNTALTTLSNYVFGRSGSPLPTALVPTAVTPQPGGSPLYVDLTVNPMDPGGAYSITVSNLTDKAGNPLDPTANMLAFAGFRVIVHPKVVSATAASNNTVVIVFSSAMAQVPNLLTPESYVFSGGLKAISVASLPGNASVIVGTSNQVGSKQYLTTVSTALTDPSGVTVDANNNTALFNGILTPPPVIVSNLLARTHPDGNRIDLSWVNPAAALYIKIVRKATSVPYDATDGLTIYSGAAITSYSDVLDLQDNTFYNYLVLASSDGVTYQVDPSVGIQSLSIRAIGSYEWLWDNHIPYWYKKRDLDIEDGSALLQPVVQTLGAALDVLRGELEAYSFAGDMDRASNTILPLWNSAFDFEPDGSYDGGVLRRVPLNILSIYQAKGTAPAIQSLVSVLAQWACSVREFGTQGGSIFKTYDGLASKFEATATPSQVTLARGSLTDSRQAFAVNRWQGGQLHDGMGHIFNVLSNTATQVVLQTLTAQTCNVNQTSPAGGTIIYVDSTLSLQTRGFIEIADGVNTQVAQVLSLVPNYSVTIQEPLRSTFGVGAKVFMGADLPDAEIIGTGTSITSGLRDLGKLWVTNQWTGYQLLDSSNTLFTVKSNTGNTLTVTSGSPAAGAYGLAVGYTVGANFTLRQPILRYRLYSGAHSFLHELTHDISLVGGSNDPFQRLYAGATGLGAGFSNDDFAIYVNAGVAKAVGRVGTVSLTVITDPNASFVPHTLAGLYINPNRKQQRTFLIVDNTATTITVAQNVQGICSANDFYFVLSNRDNLKYNRLNQVLPNFYTPHTRGYLFFS